MRCGVLWFVHVPKTGGTTVTQWLKKYGYSNGWWPLYTLSKNQYRTYGSNHQEARLPMAHVVNSGELGAAVGECKRSATVVCLASDLEGGIAF